MRLVDGLDYRYTGSDQEIICSTEAISGIAGVLDRLGASRAMVVCGPSILAHSDVVPRVQDALGSREAGLFTGIAPHSPVEVLYEAVAMARGLEPDVLVAKIQEDQPAQISAAVNPARQLELGPLVMGANAAYHPRAKCGPFDIDLVHDRLNSLLA